MTSDPTVLDESDPLPGGEAERPRLSTSGKSLLGIAERYALVGLLVVVCIVFSILPATRSTFPTVTNIRQVLVNQAVVTIIAIGAIFPLVAGSFDLSVGSIAGVSAIATASSMSRFQLPLFVAIIIGIGIGALIGAANGLLIAKGRFNAFIVTLGVNTFLTGLVVWYTQGNNITTGISSALSSFGSGSWLGITPVLYLVVLVVLLGWYVLGHTPFGRYIHALGSNPRAAQLVGINVTRLVFLTFLVSGSLAGVAGVVMVAISSGAIVTQGSELLFPVLTAVFLGATTIDPGRYNVFGTIVGVLFVAFSVSGLILLGAADWVNDVFDGAALVAAVAISTTLARQRRRVGA